MTRPGWHGFVDAPAGPAVGRVEMPLPPAVDPWAPHPLFPPRGGVAISRLASAAKRPAEAMMIR